MSTTLSIIGVFLALAILIVGTMKGIKLFPLIIVGVVVVAITNSIDIWTAFSVNFVGGLQSAMASFFILVSAATIYSQMMNRTGSTNAIAYWCIRTFGKQNAVLVLMVITGILGLAGLNGMMMVFAVYGILCIIMKEANLPREMAGAFIFFGCGLFAEGYFPASVHLNNILPTQFLGTTLMAAPLLGLGTGLITIVFAYIYLKRTSVKLAGQGIGWTDPGEGSYVFQGASFTEETAPSAIKAFIPMFWMIALVLILSYTTSFASALIAVISMVSATIVCALLNLNVLKSANTKITVFLQDCFDQIWSSCGGLAAIFGFASVITNSPGFQSILNWLVSLDISVYVKAALCSGTLAAASGSSATGARLTGQYLGEYLVSSGADLDVLHRVIAEAVTIGTEVPHCSAIYLILTMFGIEYKKGYKHIAMLFWVGGLIALIVTLAIAIFCY